MMAWKSYADPRRVCRFCGKNGARCLFRYGYVHRHCMSASEKKIYDYQLQMSYAKEASADRINRERYTGMSEAKEAKAQLRHRVYFCVKPGEEMKHNSTWADRINAKIRARELENKGYGTEIVSYDANFPETAPASRLPAREEPEGWMCGSTKAPSGWECTREKGHDGACAARVVTKPSEDLYRVSRDGGVEVHEYVGDVAYGVCDKCGRERNDYEYHTGPDAPLLNATALQCKPHYGNSTCASCGLRLRGKKTFSVPIPGITYARRIVCEKCAAIPCAIPAPESTQVLDQGGSVGEVKLQLPPLPDYVERLGEGGTLTCAWGDPDADLVDLEHYISLREFAAAALKENVELRATGAKQYIREAQIAMQQARRAETAESTLAELKIEYDAYRQEAKEMFAEDATTIALRDTEIARLKLAYGLVLELHGCGVDNCTEELYLKDAGEMIQAIVDLKAELARVRGE